jgi:hypothetical protein
MGAPLLENSRSFIQRDDQPNIRCRASENRLLFRNGKRLDEIPQYGEPRLVRGREKIDRPIRTSDEAARALIWGPIRGCSALLYRRK